LDCCRSARVHTFRDSRRNELCGCRLAKMCARGLEGAKNGSEMRLQNKHPELHYMLCLGSELRRDGCDIVRGPLPDDMRERLKALEKQSQQEAAGSNGETRDRSRGPSGSGSDKA
jgi:hypothetical protein